MIKIIVVFVLAYIIIQTLYTAYFFSKSASLVKKVHTGTFTFGDKSNPAYSIFIDGDSVAAGVGASSPTNAIEGLIGKHLSKDKFVTIQNSAVSGAKMADLIDKKVPDKKQDLILLIISSNNLFRFTDTKEFQTDTGKVFAKYAPLAKKVIVIGPGRIFDTDAIPVFMKPIYRFKAPDYVIILENEAKKYDNVVYINPTDSKISQKGYSYTGAADHFHPNDEGQKFWFNLIKPSL